MAKNLFGHSDATGQGGFLSQYELIRPMWAALQGVGVVTPKSGYWNEKECGVGTRDDPYSAIGKGQAGTRNQPSKTLDLK